MSTLNSSQLSQCDRCVLNLVRSHLLQADESRLASSQLQQLLREFRAALEQGGIISLSGDGAIQFMTERAEELLKRYFSPYSSPTALPTHLKQWFEYQISQLKAESNNLCLCLMLHIEQGGQELNIRLIPEPIREHYLLLLEEKQQSILSIASLEWIGLSKREAEVLFWIAKDQSNAGIAKMLGCSEGTVRKHLEHIYKKLGVQTRMGAVMVALERLGLIKG